MMKIRNLSTISLLLICWNVFAQQSGKSIYGITTEFHSGQTLIGTNILLYLDSADVNNPEKAIRGISSNKYGFYSFENLDEKKYYIFASYIGYKSKFLEVDLTSKENQTRVDLKLESTEIKLDEVIVENRLTKETIPSTITLSPDFIKSLPSLSGTTNLFQILQTLPGITTANELSSGVYIRGGSPDQNLTLIDGMMLYNPSHIGNFSTTFNSDAIQDMKLYKGAYPAEYGGRLSSVLDIKLKAGTKETDKMNFNLGLISSSLNMEGPIFENATYNFSGTLMYFDLLQKQVFKSDNVPFYGFKDFNAKITYTLSDVNILSLSGFVSSDYFYDDRKSSEVKYDDKWKNLAANLNWLEISPNSVFSNTSISVINYETQSIFKNDSFEKKFNDYYTNSKLTDIILKRTQEYQKSWFTLKWGFEASLHHYNLIASNFYSFAIESNPEVRKKITNYRVNGFIQNDFKIFDNLFSNLGVRINYQPDGKYLHFEPRVSASFYFTENLSWKLAYAITHQYIHYILRDDLTIPTDFWYPSNKTIKPAKSSQMVSSFDLSLAQNTITISIDGYYRNMKNLLEFKFDANFDSQAPIENILTVGEGESYGIEFFLQKKSAPIGGWLGYSLSWTKRKFPELNLGRIFSPRFDTRHNISLILTYKLSNNINIGASWIYSSGQAVNTPDGQYTFNSFFDNNIYDVYADYGLKNNYRLPSYHKLDINFSYKTMIKNTLLEIYLNIYNLYNRKNVYSQYIDKDEEKNQLVMKRLTLFPFIPTIGVKVNF